jgi:hypothetical protein
MSKNLIVIISIILGIFLIGGLIVGGLLFTGFNYLSKNSEQIANQISSELALSSVSSINSNSNNTVPPQASKPAISAVPQPSSSQANNSINNPVSQPNPIVNNPPASGGIQATGGGADYTVFVLNHGNYTGTTRLNPVEGFKYYQVEVSITSNVDYATEITPFIDMVLIDQTGKENIPAITGNGIGSTNVNTITGSLAPRSAKTGIVVFEIPLNATSLTFKYEPALGLDGAYQAKLL